MIYSMTGYGQVKSVFKDKEITVELRCLNSKMNDFRLKTPNAYRHKELELRKLLNDAVVRGKLDFNLSVISSKGDEDYSLNKNLFKSFYNQIHELGIDLSQTDILNAILQFPNVIEPNSTELQDDEYEFTLTVIKEALEKLNDFRIIEGATIENEFLLRIKIITDHLVEVANYEKERQDQLREKILKSLNSTFSNENIDMNRFEQELMYYMERLDITEEKVRLKQHCDYFLAEMDVDTVSKSKKLNFISQEMGREINTLGAKAQHSSIQKLVVVMKDELEKIKEQLANIL
ncbi:MAG: YicC family protein [Saprospiraceae bacterium]|nr:YicC family protein [Saprospiraceae bacterium]MBK7809970.1 YicC family protein [Saprospiraceae bacterium]MBK9629574.1 YicC family protein [Saprospiraceae bacterium]